MSSLFSLIVCLLLSASIATGGTKPTKPQPGKKNISTAVGKTRTHTPRLESISNSIKFSAESSRKKMLYESDCTVFVDYPQQALYDWLAGDEIYYAYQDLFFPLVGCDTLYPFVVTHIGMTLVLNAAGTFNMQAFVSELDPLYSSPVCPVPGNITYLGNEYPIEIPYPEVYSIILPLEQPVPVYGPYFACIYFGSDMTGFYPGIAMDTVAYLCINYNEWGEGLVDLSNNDYYNFPGLINIFSIGYSKAGKLPQPRFIVPSDSGVTMPGKTIWVAEGNDLANFQGAKFEYLRLGNWYEFGTDFDGSIPLRDGVTAAQSSNGWSTIWQPFGLSEGNYLLRVSIGDVDSTYTSDTAAVYLDLKKLAPAFVNRPDRGTVCAGESLKVTIEDENPIAVTFGYRYLPNSENRTLSLLNRQNYGDANGNPNDGNHNYSGEFGEYYVAPTLMASTFKHWFDKGYIELMSEGSTFLTISQIVEKLAKIYRTRENVGTQDDNLVSATMDYLRTHGDRIKIDAMQKPNWSWFKSAYLGRGGTVAFAIDRPFGNWLAVQNIDYSLAANDSFPVTYYDPVGGLSRSSYLIARGDSLVLGYLPNNAKYRVQLGVALYPKQETLGYTNFWTDFNSLDGFNAILPSGTFQENLYYLVRARALDGNNDVADSYWIMKYTCASGLKHGDADHNNVITVSDAVYIISYIFGGGPAPYSTTNGDADCNNLITVSDAVYIISYIFGGGPAPCP